MLEVITFWSGWIVAIGMGIWKIVETVRNRPAIKFFIGIPEDEGLLHVVVMNTGRRPINLIRAGLEYSDGSIFKFDDSFDVYLGWLYNMDPKINRLSLKRIKEFIKEIDADAGIMVKFIYFTNENGDRYRVKIRSDMRDVLHS